jgi:hypothetical protein
MKQTPRQENNEEHLGRESGEKKNTKERHFQTGQIMLFSDRRSQTRLPEKVVACSAEIAEPHILRVAPDMRQSLIDSRQGFAR